MEEDLKKYTVDGISIKKCDNGYIVFTVPTQSFYISSLDELTPERFELAIKSLKERDDLQNELFKEYWKEFIIGNSEIK